MSQLNANIQAPSYSGSGTTNTLSLTCIVGALMFTTLTIHGSSVTTSSMTTTSGATAHKLCSYSDATSNVTLEIWWAVAKTTDDGFNVTLSGSGGACGMVGGIAFPSNGKVNCQASWQADPDNATATLTTGVTAGTWPSVTLKPVGIESVWIGVAGIFNGGVIDFPSATGVTGSDVATNVGGSFLSLGAVLIGINSTNPTVNTPAWTATLNNNDIAMLVGGINCFMGVPPTLVAP